jgi:hypothetical protein
LLDSVVIHGSLLCLHSGPFACLRAMPAIVRLEADRGGAAGVGGDPDIGGRAGSLSRAERRCQAEFEIGVKDGDKQSIV